VVGGVGVEVLLHRGNRPLMHGLDDVRAKEAVSNYRRFEKQRDST
jgi:hypothetical protein